MIPAMGFSLVAQDDKSKKKDISHA